MKVFFCAIVILAIVQTAFTQQTGCVTLFAQCNYQGQNVQVCGSNPTVAAALKNFTVRSVQVPEGHSVTFYNKVNFEDQSLVLTTSAACLSTPLHLSLTQLRGSELSINSLQIKSAQVN